MNSIILCFALAFSAGSDTACKDKFYETALNDTIHVGGPYIKFTIQDSTGSKSVLFLANSVYGFFKYEYGMSFDSYRAFMKEVLDGKKSISSSTFKKLPPHLTLRNDKYVERIARKGKRKLIDHFFTRNVFKIKYQGHFEAVVAKLFDCGVLVATVENGADAIVYIADCY